MLILLCDDNAFSINPLALREDPKMLVAVVKLRKGSHLSILIEVTAI